MKIDNTIEKLEYFNKWRRGENEDLAMPDPKQLGLTIEDAIALLNEYSKLKQWQPEYNDAF